MSQVGSETWSVVKFPEENSVTAVPTSWLHGSICFWPPFSRKIVQAAIERGDPPNINTWQQFDYLALRNNVFDSFKEAERKSRKALETSDLESQIEDNDESIGKRKRRVPKHFDDDHSCSSEHENTRSDLPKPPKPPAMFKKRTTIQKPVGNIKIVQSHSQQISNTFDNVNIAGTSTFLNHEDISIQQSPTTSNRELSTPQNSRSPHVEKHNCGDIGGYLKQILRKQNILQCMVTDMNTKLIEIENFVKTTPSHATEAVEVESIFVKVQNLPVDSDDALQELENFLADHNEFNEARRKNCNKVMDKKDIEATLKAANEYLLLLRNLETELDCAENQIKDTAEETKKKITTTFANLISSITTCLIKRQNELVNKVKSIKENALVPLQDSQILILNKIKDTTTLIAEGNSLLAIVDGKVELEQFYNKSSLLGTLPEVPQLKEVPYIFFQQNLPGEDEILSICKAFGCVTHIAPVQLSILSERPGAILTEWSLSENEERFVEKYHLQKAFGDAYNNKGALNYSTCYIGPDIQYLVKDLNLNQNYTFKVSCKFERDECWSTWSLPIIGRTTIQPFSWENNNNFTISNENKIASPLRESSVLFSREIQFNVGYSVELTFLEIGDDIGSFVGLVTSNLLKDLHLIDAHICFATNGNIYGSGIKKAMQFVPVTKNTKIYFICDYKKDGKLRIHLDCDNSRVTYDWFVDEKNVYIAARFNSNKWKIMIN
ncbi:hypothetical protein FQA39_LY17306 [Lamprigera yunnana]|nr:hypothetical protein FQA39_LY17306 [Lamprigera yunnana]